MSILQRRRSLKDAFTKVGTGSDGIGKDGGGLLLACSADTHCTAFSDCVFLSSFLFFLFSRVYFAVFVADLSGLVRFVLKLYAGKQAAGPDRAGAGA